VQPDVDHVERKVKQIPIAIRIVWILYFASLFNLQLFLFLARDSIRQSVRPSVRQSVTRVDQSKTVEVGIMQFSPYSSPIPLVFAG